MILSIIIPAYNEERTLGAVLEKITRVPIQTTSFQIEIVVVDDGSSDRTAEIAASFKGVRCIKQSNQGKGAAVQRGVQDCLGEYLLVQDADLEYDPMDYLPMLKALPATGWAVVYGSRILGQRDAEVGFNLFPGKHPQQSLGPWLANRLMSLWTLMLYGKWISDPATAYKLYPTQLVREMKVHSTGFEADHEMTAKLIRKHVPIYEVPVRYIPRTEAEGKKIRAIDGVIALWTLFKYRWAN